MDSSSSCCMFVLTIKERRIYKSRSPVTAPLIVFVFRATPVHLRCHNISCNGAFGRAPDLCGPVIRNGAERRLPRDGSILQVKAGRGIRNEIEN